MRKQHGSNGRYLQRKINGKQTQAHTVIAEKALGKILPKGAVVHHINGNGQDNRPENLVICPDQKYHRLLHRRAEALEKAGNPDFRYCNYCKQWDSLKNLYIGISNDRIVHHVKCYAAYRYRIEKAKKNHS